MSKPTITALVHTSPTLQVVLSELNILELCTAKDYDLRIKRCMMQTDPLQILAKCTNQPKYPHKYKLKGMSTPSGLALGKLTCAGQWKESWAKTHVANSCSAVAGICLGGRNKAKAPRNANGER